MPIENTNGSVEVVTAPLPKYVQEKASGRVYRVDKEIPAGVLVTELDEQTHKPLGQSPSGLTNREAISNNFDAYPLADVDYFKEVRQFRTVREIATDRIYYVLNCNLDQATLRLQGTDHITKIPIQVLYGHFEVVKDNIVCTTCNTTSLKANRVLN